MSEITKKQLSQADLQTGSDIVVLQDHALTLDASDGGKVKRILHSQLKATYLEDYTIGGGGQKAILTNDAEQTVTNKTLDGCVLKDCTFAETPPGGGDPGHETTVSELIAEKVAEEVAGIEVEVSRDHSIVYESAHNAGEGLTVEDILQNADYTSKPEDYCIPLRNISMMAIIDRENNTLASVTRISTVQQTINPGTPINVLCLSKIEADQPGIDGTLIIRYIPELIFAGS